tara:strand:- start:5905 stop:6114 length:210 start_codon:yes stop_codon:yes gene_type:complete
MATLETHDTRKDRNNHSANRSRSISRPRFAQNASRTVSHSDLIRGPPRLASRPLANQYHLAFLGHLDPV